MLGAFSFTEHVTFLFLVIRGVANPDWGGGEGEISELVGGASAPKMRACAHTSPLRSWKIFKFDADFVQFGDYF